VGTGEAGGWEGFWKGGIWVVKCECFYKKCEEYLCVRRGKNCSDVILQYTELKYLNSAL